MFLFVRRKFVDTIGSIRAGGYRKSNIKVKDIRNKRLPTVCR